MLFLQYGINDHQELIDITQVPRGKTTLHCPYCNGLLIARKGEKIAHHFAHSETTCRAAKRDFSDLSLPVYDHFNLNLPGEAVAQLRAWAEWRDWVAAKDNSPAPKQSVEIDEYYLKRYEVLKWNDYKGHDGGWEITKKGKLILGELSLDLFNQFQEPLIAERHEHLERKAEAARETVDYETYQTDLRLYQMQMRRLLTCTLYFLRVEGEGLTNLYKIGITARPIEQRVAEIQADLNALFGQVTISVLGTWAARGNVELYFKYRYRKQQFPLDNGRLTEYFQFSDVNPVLRDLRRMKTKALTDLERAVLYGEPTPLQRQRQKEQLKKAKWALEKAQRQQEAQLEVERRRQAMQLEAEQKARAVQIEAKRRAGIKQGLQRAAKLGKAIGRPAGHAPPEQVLSQPYAAAVTKALEAGYSLREAASIAGVAVNTVQKVKRALDLLGRPVSRQKPKLTVADLPETDDPQVLFDFCAERAGTIRWEAWQDGRCTNKNQIYWLSCPTNRKNNWRAQTLYLGKTMAQVAQVFVWWVNTGKDRPLQRLRLTNSEKNLLIALHREPGDEYWVEQKQAQGLLDKGLLVLILEKLPNPNSSRTRPFSLTEQGKHIALLLEVSL